MIKCKEVEVDAKYKDFLGIMGLCLFSWSFILFWWVFKGF